MKKNILGLLLLAALGASATSSFTVTASGSTFTITRSGEGTNAAETVRYRTVSCSAFAGRHFVEGTTTALLPRAAHADQARLRNGDPKLSVGGTLGSAEYDILCGHGLEAAVRQRRWRRRTMGRIGRGRDLS